jgi:hypothetical protein
VSSEGSGAADCLGTGWGRGVREGSGRVGKDEGNSQRWMTRGPRCGLVVTCDAVVGSAIR